MSLVDYEVHGAVAQITLDRPPVNAINGELIADLDAVLAEAEDPAIRAVVINGTKHFAAGADIKRFVDAFESDDPEPQASGLGAAVLRFEALEKPTIAAISGYALGGGLELADRWSRPKSKPLTVLRPRAPTCTPTWTSRSAGSGVTSQTWSISRPFGRYWRRWATRTWVYE